MSELDSNFEALATQINAKLKEATDALREVNRLKDEAKLPALILSVGVKEELSYYGRDADEEEKSEILLEELEEKLDLFNVKDLENELNQAGWSTSSSYC